MKGALTDIRKPTLALLLRIREDRDTNFGLEVGYPESKFSVGLLSPFRPLPV
jgi:hypothetical protein